LIRDQAFGEALDPGKLEGFARYDVHLDRKLERMLTMLLHQARSEIRLAKLGALLGAHLKQVYGHHHGEQAATLNSRKSIGLVGRPLRRGSGRSRLPLQDQ
jgi:hypothetical protein